MGITEWILLGVAVAAVLVVYLATRRSSGPNPWRDMEQESDELPAEQSQAQADDAQGVIVDPAVADEWSDFAPDRSGEPQLDGSPDVDDINPSSIKAEAPPDDEPEEEIEQKIVVLHVVGRDNAYLSGNQIHTALQHCNLHFGPREIFHRVTDVNGKAQSVFSVANMLKPGTLRPEDAGSLSTRGLVMFLVLPAPVDANKAFHDMLNTAQGLAGELNGVVLDDKRLPLTRQAAQYKIDEIAEYQRRQRLAGI